MTDKQTVKPPLWFWIVSVLALLWNLMGVGAYLGQAFMSIEGLEKMTQAERLLYESQPAWVTGAFAIAVWAGALGCLALLLKKKMGTASIVSILSRNYRAHNIYVFYEQYF